MVLIMYLLLELIVAFGCDQTFRVRVKINLEKLSLKLMTYSYIYKREKMLKT